jgi:hypothetical protein
MWSRLGAVHLEEIGWRELVVGWQPVRGCETGEELEPDRNETYAGWL